MKKILTLGLLTCGLLFTACNRPIEAYKDNHTPLQVSMSDYGLQWKLRVTVMPPERLPGGQLKVTLQVYNTTQDDITVDYKYSFTDKAGTPIENSNIGWETERIAPRAYQTVTFTSMSAAPEDFRVQLRPANR